MTPEDILERLQALGAVYVEPPGWDCFKEGGPPEIPDCQRIDLEAYIEDLKGNVQ